MPADARTDETRFRPTLWPGVPIPVPSVLAGPAFADDQGFLEWRLRELVELPDELCLRGLLDLDVQEADDVLAFVSEHGAITQRWDLDNGSSPALVPPDGKENHLTDVQHYLGVAQRLSRHVVAHLDGSPVHEAWVGLPSPPAIWAPHKVPAPNDARPGLDPEHLAWFRFAMLINDGLRAFHTRVEVPFTSAFAPDTDLYSALCLQLVNLLAEGPAVKRCANEPCGRAFVRQEGRAEHGQHRMSGVLYCSRSCAKAQSERVRRRRKREEQR